MFNESFYPTPPRVAEEMLSLFTAEDLWRRRILEPSAGKGDLADAITHYCARYAKKHNKDVHCIEPEPELQAALKGKGYTLVAMDFLTYQPQDHYDLIIMNPPFSNGDDHLLHAWDVLYGGDIVCLLNANTLNNPNTAKRRLLDNLVSGHGRVTKLGRCFDSVEAFRKTSVEVAMVHLRKEAPKVHFSFDSEDFQHDRKFSFDASDLKNQVALNDKVGNLVLVHEKCLLLFRDISRLFIELEFYAKSFGSMSTLTKGFFEEVKYGRDQKDAQAQQERYYDLFSAALKAESWDKVFEMTKMADLVSTKVREDFHEFRRGNSALSFSKENIKAILGSLFHSRGDIFRQCIEEVFDRMTRYDKRNMVHVEGWKTNDAYKVNRKVITPIAEYGYDNDSWRQWASIPYQARERLNDIDRAMGFLVGKNLTQVHSIAQALERHIGTRDNFNFSWYKNPFESEFFNCRVYLKGTIHLTFKDEWLWEKFNIEAAKGKNWLPDDYKEREKAADEFAVVPLFTQAAAR